MNGNDDKSKELCTEIISLLKKIAKEQINLRKDYLWLGAIVFGFIAIDFLLKIK